jgi:uncharacterized protein (TIGR02145 family)
MKKKNGIKLYLTMFMGFAMLFSISCKKDESPSKKKPVITWANPADITTETWLSSTQLNAIANVAGSFVYSPAIDTRLNVGAHQVLQVYFTPTDIATYDTVSKSVMINVTQATALTDIDGNVYNIVIIGTQTWLAQNLKTTKYRDGSSIPLITDEYEWINSATAGYCWSDDDPTNRSIYGAFYNWYAVNTGKLAPKGWHVPTEADWITLQNYLGGVSVTGGKLKETGTVHWNTPNTGATNESGFLALPGGYRSKANGTFPTKFQKGVWWSSTGSISSFGRFIVSYNSASSDYQNDNGAFGFSVRCIRD